MPAVVIVFFIALVVGLYIIGRIGESSGSCLHVVLALVAGAVFVFLLLFVMWDALGGAS